MEESEILGTCSGGKAESWSKATEQVTTLIRIHDEDYIIAYHFL